MNSGSTGQHHHHPNAAAMTRGLIMGLFLVHSILFAVYDFNMATTTTWSSTTASDLSSHPPDRRRVATTTQATATPRLPAAVAKRKSILVTGGAGFVGSHVVEYLLNAQQEKDGDLLQYDIVIIDEVNDYYDTTIKESNLEQLMNVSTLLSQQQQRPMALHFYRGDICNTTLLDIIFTHHNIVSICHMAARAGVRPSIDNPYVYIHSNIIGTITLMQYAVQYEIQNFVFASSSSVYGGSKSTYFTETEPVDHPISPYAATKKACELFSYMYSYQHQLNISALRFFTVYGPRGRPDMAPYKFIDRISRGVEIQQYGDGTSSRDYTYISDIVSGVIKSLLYYPSRYSIYNLGKGNGTTLNDFVHYVETYVNTSATIQLLPDQPGDVPYTCANITKARLDLQYQPLVPFPNGIQKTVQWYQQRRLQHQQQKLQASSDKSNKSQRRRRLSRQELPTTEMIQFDDEMTDVIPKVAMQKQQRRRRLQQQDSSQQQRTPVVSPQVGHKSIAVSGAISSNEFVGRHVVETLLRRGDDVILIDDDDDYDIGIHATSSHTALSYIKKIFGANRQDLDAKRGKLSIYLGNRNNSTFLEHVFHQEQPTHVFHFGLDKYALSASSSFQNNDEFERSKIYVKKNVEILVRLLEVSRHGGKTTTSTSEYKAGTVILKDDIQNFVFTSSDAVYGYEAAATMKDRESDNGTSSSNGELHKLWSETDRVDYPKSSYGASMKSAELLGYTYHHLYNIPMSILRLFNVYGPYQAPRATNPSQQLFDVLAKERLKEASKPHRNSWESFDFSTLDFTYISDTVQGIISSIDRPYEYEIFNLGSGNDNCEEGVTNLIHEAAAELSLPEETTKKIVSDFQESMSAQSNLLVDGISCANIQKARDLLQYNPGTSLSFATKRTIEWHRQHDYNLVLVENNVLPMEAATSMAVATDSNATKPCPKEVIVLLANHLNYPRILRELAIIQWLILVVIISFCFVCRLRSGSASITISALIQSKPPSPTKDGRLSPKREHVWKMSTCWTLIRASVEHGTRRIAFHISIVREQHT